MPDKDPKDETRGPPAASSPPPGEFLAGARRKHGWTPERVAQELNLDADTVLALEESRFETLGAPVFARGHLRKYADLLDIDPDDVLAAYDATINGDETPELPSAPGLAVGAMAAKRRLGPLVTVVVVAAVAMLLWRIIGNAPDDSDAVDQRQEPALADETSVIESEPTPASLPESPDTAATAVVFGPDAPPPTAPSPDSSAEEVATMDDASDTMIQPAPATGDAAPLPAAATSTAVASMRITLRFTADSWVEVRDAEGDRLVYQLQSEGTSRAVSGTPPFRLFLGFADGVQIEVDGQPLTIPAERRLGNTARFQIPLSADDVSRR